MLPDDGWQSENATGRILCQHVCAPARLAESQCPDIWADSLHTALRGTFRARREQRCQLRQNHEGFAVRSGQTRPKMSLVVWRRPIHRPGNRNGVPEPHQPAVLRAAAMTARDRGLAETGWRNF